MNNKRTGQSATIYLYFFMIKKTLSVAAHNFHKGQKDNAVAHVTVSTHTKKLAT